MGMCFQYDYQRQYTTTITRAVGPTTLVGARGTLPQPAPDDTNAVWLAPNGSDAGANGAAGTGTQSAPVLTLAKAIAVTTAQASRPTIHIFRNGYVGDLIFVETVDSVLPASRNVQSAEGEIGIIEYQNASRFILNSGCRLNGIEVRNTPTSGTSITVMGHGGASVSDVRISNCRIKSQSTVFSISFTPITTDSVFEYTHFLGNGNEINFPNSASVDINNCIFQRFSNAFDFIFPAIFTSQTINTHAFDISRTLFIGYQGGVNPVLAVTANGQNVANSVMYVLLSFATTSAPGVVINFRGCAFLDTDYSVGIIDGAVPADPFVSINYFYSYDLASNGIYALWNNNPASTNANFTLTNTSPIDPQLPAMFVDFQGGVTDKDVQLFRLQALGKSAPDGAGRYFIDSPLIDAYDTGSGLEDVNPWDETTTFVSDSFGQTLIVDWPPASVVISNQVRNPVSLTDVKGNLHIDHDAFRRSFQFQYGDNIHLSNLLFRKLDHMLQDKGVKKFYPLGEGANLYTDGGAVTLPATFSSVDNSIEPTASDVMAPNWWRGFWVTMGANEYYIESNDSEKIYLADKLGLGFPSDGIHDFSIQYTLVQNEPTDFLTKQQNFTEFRKGGAWGNDDTTIRPYDFTIDGFTVKEVEDYEENL